MEVLPPEYKFALNVIDKYLSRNCKLSFLNKMSEDVMEEGNISILKKKFKSREIPAGTNWRWNQVKSRKIVQLPASDVRAEFFKLMPRKINRNGILPSFSCKLWQFNIIDIEGNVLFRVLWCEKGKKTQFDLDDYTFLASFMEPHLANELWPELLS